MVPIPTPHKNKKNNFFFFFFFFFFFYFHSRLRCGWWLGLAGWLAGWWMINEQRNHMMGHDYDISYLTADIDNNDLRSCRSSTEWLRAFLFASSLARAKPHISLSQIANITEM